jgi:carboxylesterase
VTALALLGLVAFVWLARQFTGSWMERATTRRLPLGSDGVIEGAGAIIRPGSSRSAVLILHGFGDTPQTLVYLADHLHGLGFTVHAPLLPGHGRTLAEFGASEASSWIAAGERELLELRRRFAFVGLVGVSMGGALSVILSSGSNRASAGRADGNAAAGPDALVLIAPYLSMRARARRIAALHWPMSRLTRYLPSREDASVRDPVERARNRGFGTVTPRLLHELRGLVVRARAALPGVEQPTLVIQSRDDNRIDQGAAMKSFELLGAKEKRFVWTEGSGHLITVDTGRERVLRLTGEWLSERAGEIATRPTTVPPEG